MHMCCMPRLFHIVRRGSQRASVRRWLRFEWPELSWAWWLVGLGLPRRRRRQLGVLVIYAGKAVLQATNCFAKILAKGRQTGRPK